MAGTRQNNTMQEGLMQLLSALSQLKAAPDADLDYLSSIEAGILEKLRAPMREAAAKLAQAGGVTPPGGGPAPGGAPGAGAAPPTASAAGPGGDELRRLVASQGMR